MKLTGVSSRPSKAFILGFVILLTTIGHMARADLPRTPVRNVPHLFGRDMERLVLMAPIILDRSKPGVPFNATIMVRIRPDIFIPVTEDAEGIFYQAESGYRTIRGNGLTPGGLYVSKLRPQEIWVYVGNAQMGSKSGVEKDNLPLSAQFLRHLRTGKADRKK